jgi:protein farnesyltransferase subunit beta
MLIGTSSFAVTIWASVSVQHRDPIRENSYLHGYRVTSTFLTSQNATGGFGGGHGQASHIATSYAAVLSIISVSSPSNTAPLDSINRMTMWRFLGSMKQPSGGFTMAAGGELDIRGAYCAMVLLSLLNLPLSLPHDSPGRAAGFETFTDGLPEWLGRCQTYEGGIAGAPHNEAHGAYAFCGIGALSILGPPQETLPKYFDVKNLLHWLASQQRAPEGGFAGRVNKLVDGCYSHWVGGTWALLNAALAPQTPELDLWCREGLARYILCCAQTKKGGLRDKPSKAADAYHSCYNLVGLAAAQNIFEYVPPVPKRGAEGKADAEDEDSPNNELTAAFGWRVSGPADVPCEEDDRVRTVHPVFAIPFERAKECREYFESSGAL